MNYEQRIQAAESRIESRRAGREALTALDVKQHIAPVYGPLDDDIKAGAHEIYNLPGGRGSGKSSFASLEIVSEVMRDSTDETNAIVFRLVARTMRESVYTQIAWAIDALGVSHLWRGTVSPMQYEYKPTGAVITFRGLYDKSKLKSVKPKRGTYRLVWFEEFSELPGPSFTRSIMQSVIRGGEKFVIFRSFNPPVSANNWANLLVQEPDERAVTLHTDYTMIPAEWLGDSFIYEAERLRELNPTAYKHEYMGEPTGTGGEVFPNITVRTITDEEAAAQDYVFQGADFGFAVDPACFIRVSYDRKSDTILLLDEIYKRNLSNAELARLIKEKGYNVGKGPAYRSIYGDTYGGFERQVIFCDAAEPKSIADLRDAGLKALACHKEPNCVMYRVKWLQHRRIVIDPKRTPEAYREFVNYSYQTDKDGNFLSVLPDKDNHSIDAVAYALDRQIYKKGVSA